MHYSNQDYSLRPKILISIKIQKEISKQEGAKNKSFNFVYG